MTKINEGCILLTKQDMKRYRPYLSEQYIRIAIQNILDSGKEPICETDQDIWWNYKKNLEECSK